MASSITLDMFRERALRHLQAFGAHSTSQLSDLFSIRWGLAGSRARRMMREGLITGDDDGWSIASPQPQREER